MLRAEGASRCRSRPLVVDGNALQEDLLSVEQDLAALRVDGPQADPVRHGIRLRDEAYIVAFRVVRAPETDIGPAREGEGETGAAVGVRGQFDAHLEFRNLHADALRQRGAVQLDPPLDAFAVGGKFEFVVPDEGLRDVQQADAAGDAAVVPPVGVDSGDAVRVALVVHLDHQRVLPRLQLLRDLEIEGREAARMLADQAPVQGRDRLVVGAVEMEEIAVPRLRGRVEEAPVPDRPFVIVQLLPLGIPVAGHFQRARRVEIVFDQFRLVGIEMPVGEESLRRGHRHHAVTVIAVLVRIHDGAPGPVQGLPGAGGGVLDARRSR